MKVREIASVVLEISGNALGLTRRGVQAKMFEKFQVLNDNA